jgi:hypothetical protein
MKNSPYQNQPTENWLKITESLIKDQVLNLLYL